MIRWGLDPDELSLSDWVEIGWSWILDQAPPTSDQTRWRTLMYEAIWLGKEPELTAEERKSIAERRLEDVKQGIGTGPTQAERDAMEALMERAKRLRGESDA